MTPANAEGRYVLALDSSRDLIRVTHWGAMPLKLARASRRDAAAMAQESGARAILVDLRGAEIRFSTTDHYLFHREHVSVYPRGACMAYVCTPKQLKMLAADEGFAENVAKNRGFTIKGFDSFEAAEAWAHQTAAPRSTVTG